ncbi:NUCLEOLAR PROTEIN 7/ESTROGEN RECEPTOR COACTIVATOR-RELATED [Salix purpurea]|uniref:Oxidation resistance protein 1 n=1 Tax=Salix purpurea TaxID=77065 RepID=A0A9Q0V2D0_SALPP|nr:NUCLEOLAR PROTEIN 7/ESTROGEN RECEPTOR COACTIVATOR-RELATED [Salix purpurea]
MGKQQKSLRSKAVHFVSDLTTVILNPISDKPSKHPTPLPHPPPEDVSESKRSQLEFVAEEDTGHSVEEPDTSSFTAFLYSLLSSSESGNNPKLDEQNDHSAQMGDQLSENVAKVSGMKKGLFSTGKQTLRSIYQATRIGGYRSQESKGNSDLKNSDEIDDFGGLEAKSMLKQNMKEPVALGDLPGISEPSMLLSEKERSILYVSLPAVVQGRKWLLLYSTWRHGISLSSLYRRSTLWSGPSLLVVGDRKGAVFGGLVEAPLRPTNKKYQGTNSTFVFTNTPGHPVIFRPTGANRYYTLCSTDFLAIGGGGRFALYMDSDLLNGSSSVSETYGNPCLAYTEDFEVKEVELWGFVYGSKYEEILALSRIEAPGICRF